MIWRVKVWYNSSLARERSKCAGRTERLTRETLPQALPIPTCSLKSVCESRREMGSRPPTTELLPATGNVGCSYGGAATRSRGNNWTAAVGGEWHSWPEWGQDLCFLETLASALLLPLFLKYNFPSYKYLSKAEEQYKTAQSWWQR